MPSKYPRPPALPPLLQQPMYLTPSDYQSALLDDLSHNPYIPELHNGRINPYTGVPIQCQADWLEYRRMYVMKDLLSRAYCAREQQIDLYWRKSFESIVASSENRLKTSVERIRLEESSNYSNRLYAIRFWTVCISLCLIAAFFFWLLPKAKDSAYEKGRAAGYESGYIIGNEMGSAGVVEFIEEVVYVTDSGKKYHREDCFYLRSKNSIPLAMAKHLGYSPCSRCKP